MTIDAAGETDIAKAVSMYPRQRGAGIGLFFTDFLFSEGAEAALKKLLARGLIARFSRDVARGYRPNLRGI